MTASLLSESNTPWPVLPRERGLVAEALALRKERFSSPLLCRCILLAMTVFVMIVLDEPEKEPLKFEGNASKLVKKDDFKAAERKRPVYEADAALAADATIVG